jgi:survival motor neuron protein
MLQDHDDIWDDSLLIKAYEESLKLQKEEVAKKLAMKTNKKTSSNDTAAKEEEPFNVGDFVRCTFEDGVDYEAEILSINENGRAMIKYVGYDNEQRVNLEDLVQSWGIEAREEQKLLAEADKPQNSNDDEELDNHQEELHNFVLNKSHRVHGKLPIPPMVRLINYSLYFFLIYSLFFSCK